MRSRQSSKPTLFLVAALALGCGGSREAPPAAAPAPTPGPALAGAPQAVSARSPASPGWSTAVTRAVRAGEYRIHPAADGFQAVNRAGDLRARWSARAGLTAWRSRPGLPDPGTAQPAGIGLRAVALGRASTAREVRSRDFVLGACRSDGARDEHGACLPRLERDLGVLSEWWENRADGIAHGFVVDKAPAGLAGAHSWLQVQVRVSGARDIALDPDARGAVLTGPGQRYAYRGLAAWDADRKTLPTRMRRAGSHLLLEVDDRAARYPVVVDPVLTLGTWGYESNQASPDGDQPAGQDMVVAGALDVNNDTHMDVLVAFPRYNGAAGNNSGIVHLFLGSPTGLATTPSWSSEGTNAANSAAGPTASSLFGRSLAAGYINGDAFADVVVGQSAWGNGEPLEGRVYVFYGQAGPTPLPALASRVLEGRSANAFFGRAVAVANLDARNGGDLIVGSSGFAGNGGRVEIYLSNASGELPADNAPSDSALGAAGSGLGEALATGDVSGDGRPDVHAVAPTQGGVNGLGALHSFVTDPGGLVDTPYVYMPSGAPDGRASKVAFAGDVNRDGFGDVATGGSANFSSSIVVLSGSPTGLTGMVTGGGRDFSSGLGLTLAGPLDIDNDGFFDVVVGSGSGKGGVYVFRGSPRGFLSLSFFSAEKDSVLEGEADGDALGSTVAVVGDLNDDGFVDILAGAAGYEDGAEIDEGKAYLMLGGLPSAKWQGQPCTLNGQCASGFCVDNICCESICGGTPGVEADNTDDCRICSGISGLWPTGACTPAPIASPCASSNLCLMSAVCDETGACVGGVPRSCTMPGDACRDPGVCNPATGLCANPPKPDSTACDDGNACTTGTTCQAGICAAGTTVTCAAPALCKLPGTCNPATGVCDYPNIPDGTACNDSNMCTSAETCLAGACITPPALTCGAESACKNAGSCDPLTGVCAQTSKADGTPCDDGNMCTLTTTCSTGTCAAGSARGCDDGNPCTTDSCAPATGCVNALIAGCVTDAGPIASDAGDAGDGGDVRDDLDGDVPDMRDAPADGSDRPNDVGAEVSGEVRPPDGSSPADRTGGSGGASDVTGADGASTTDGPRDSSGDGVPIKARGGSGCDCDAGRAGSSPSPGPLSLALLVVAAILLGRPGRRRRPPA